MALSHRSRAALLAIFATITAATAAGLGALVRAGVCLHHLSALLNHDHRMMDGMAMAGSGTAAPDATCPVLAYAALVVATLCVLSVVALLAMRPRASTVSRAAASLILALRFGPLTGALIVLGGIPLAGVMALDSAFVGAGPAVAAVALIVAAVVTALALFATARLIAAFAVRVRVALATAFRYPALTAAPLLCAVRFDAPLPLGVRIARRRPSRGPPTLL